MAEAGHGRTPKKFKGYEHVREQYGVSAVRNQYSRVRMSSKRSAEEELPRSSPRFNGLTDDVDTDDMFCLTAGYFKDDDAQRNKMHMGMISSSAKHHDMEERLKIFGMPASFPSVSKALEYKAVFKDLVETCKKPLGDLPAWKKDKEDSDEQSHRMKECDAHRSSGDRLRTQHGCLGSLQIKF